MYRTARRRVNRRSRTTRRTRGRGNNPNNKRLYNIRNSTVFRPRKPGFGNLALSFTKRLIAYPSSGVRPSPDKPVPASAWWLDKLQWFGSLALQLIGILLTTTTELDDNAEFAVTGAGTVIPISSRELLMSTPVAGKTADGKVLVPFEQSRVLWVKATVTPVVDASVIGGSYACALVPMDHGQSIADLPNTFEGIMQQPGSVIRPMSKPVSVSWSPKPTDHGYRWLTIGDENDIKHNVVAFVLAFSDLALAKADNGGTSSKEYNPGKSGFEIYFDGQVATRQPGVVTYSPKLEYSDPSMIKLLSLRRPVLAKFSDVKWRNGIGSVERMNLMHVISDEDIPNLDAMIFD